MCVQVLILATFRFSSHHFSCFVFFKLIIWGVVSERANLYCQQPNHRAFPHAVFMAITQLFPLYWGKCHSSEVYQTYCSVDFNQCDSDSFKSLFVLLMSHT